MQTVTYPSSLLREYDSHGRPRATPHASDMNAMRAQSTTTSTTSSSHSDAPHTKAVDRSYTSDVDAAEAIRDLKQRLRTAKEDSARYRSLCLRSETAFHAHRTDLDGLLAAQREGWLHRQLELREALQHALDDSQGILAKIDALRAEQEAEVRQGLEAVRTAHDERTTRLEEVIATLREECAEAAAHSEHALASHNAEAAALERALDRQVALHDELQQVKDLVLQARARRPGGRGRSLSPRGGTRRCGSALPRTVRPPARCVFLPSGLVDTSPQRRAPSPTSHHVLSLLSTIKRQNYLRPRAYEARHGLDSTATDTPASVLCAHAPQRGRRSSSPFSRRLETLEDDRWEAVEAALVGPDGDELRRRAGPSEAGAPPLLPHATTPSWPSAAPTLPSCAPHAAVRATASPPLRPAAAAAAAASHWNASPPWTTVPHPAQPSPSSPSPSSVPFHGRRVNALVRALLEEVRELRRHYAWHQAQLRDPRGDSVEASQQMRALMQVMDAKIDQVRALRAEQTHKADQLRWQETMHDIHRDNAYTDSLYRRLHEL